MPRKTQNIHSLSRGYVRSSMSKFNLFNLYKKNPIRYNGRTLYQQKWTAKAETRAYHGEHLTESRWKTIFNPSLETVAQLDASLKGSRVDATPISMQTYASLEKRLEVALFRAMFASSVRQARQFIRSGDVKVNGIVIKHPSFPLRSGDVFSVEPDKVLFAMGRSKPSLDEALKVDRNQIAAWNQHVHNASSSPRAVYELLQARPKSLDTINSKTSDAKIDIQKYNEDKQNSIKVQQDKVTKSFLLDQILKLGSGSKDVNAATFAEFGDIDSQKAVSLYQKFADSKHPLITNNSYEEIKKYLETKKEEVANNDEKHLLRLTKQVLGEIQKSRWETIRKDGQASQINENSKTIPFTTEYFKGLYFHEKLDKEKIKEDESSAKVYLPWQRGLFGRKDLSKPYFTPWTPRPFIGCFAIYPAHLEISFKTCHAVYVRDPIARPGQSEVITPFPDHVHERAYMYYARNGM
ncbi:mitochondrial 37S ribosomal protein NAM9 [Scheffersomyces amazonensis]|uniref:mitochondrial 37S ribosomal protein NAM9 n=1 Tax=Scheffersomyces amazonensis TaxID=1078765 RepID=UPI00315CFBBE